MSFVVGKREITFKIKFGAEGSGCVTVGPAERRRRPGHRGSLTKIRWTSPHC
jgi:hypothetical protein